MSLYENINKRKKAGTSRTKKKSTISDKAYANMKDGFPKAKKGGVVKKKKKAKALTKGQVATPKKHSVHHSAKHMAEMRKAMKAGSSFTASHKIAKKKIGE